MPVYNAERYLEEAMDSILNQTFSEFEFVIVNDGSKDKSDSIIRSYDDKRIKYFKHIDNLGLIATLNKGLLNCNGKYIARMDADDISQKTRLEKQYNFLKDNPDYDIVGCHLEILFESSGKQSVRKYPISEFEVVSNIIRGRHSAVHAASMYRKTVFEKLHGYRNFKHAEDIDLWFRVFALGLNTISIDESLYSYRQHEEQVTSDQNTVQKLFYRKAFYSFISSLNSKPIREKRTNKYLDIIRWKRASINFFDIINVTRILKLILSSRKLTEATSSMLLSNFYQEYLKNTVSKGSWLFIYKLI